MNKFSNSLSFPTSFSFTFFPNTELPIFEFDRNNYELLINNLIVLTLNLGKSSR